MLTIPNVQTLDVYDPTLTLGPIATTRGIKYVVANQAVLAQVAPISKSGTLEDWGDEVLITPETNSIQGAAGIRFKSAVAGSPARVVAQLYLPADPQFGSGTPFTGTLSASGAVTPTGTVGADGWVSVGTVLTYASTDGHTFVFGTSADLSAVIPVGARLKFTQGGNVFYFLVTAITGATITLYGGTDYAPVNAAVTAVSYSVAKVPLGFNPDPRKWSETLSDATFVTRAAPVNGTVYNLGSLHLDVPIGAWDIGFDVALFFSFAGVFKLDMAAALSTLNNGISDVDLVGWENLYQNVGAGTPVHREKSIILAAKTTYYLVAYDNTGNDSINFAGNQSPSRITAKSTYL